MKKEQFERLMYVLYRNNQLFIPQGQILQEWIDNAFDNAMKQGQVKNGSIPVVSESSFKTAIEYIKDSYCEAYLNTPYMLLGDVAELIKTLTGKEVDWQELSKHSR